MSQQGVRIDLHVHTSFSNVPEKALIGSLGFAESYTSPQEAYNTAKNRGMTHVTLTDHNRIEGALELAGYDDFFMSEEVSTVFPEDGCVVHIVTLDIDEEQHKTIQSLKKNIYAFKQYLHENNIYHFLAHPFYPVSGDLTFEHVEKLFVMFDVWELRNGNRINEDEALTRLVTGKYQGEQLEELSQRYGIPQYTTRGPSFVGGSDDHSGLYIGQTCTYSDTAASLAEFFEQMRAGKVDIDGKTGSSMDLSSTIYSVALRHFHHRAEKSEKDIEEMLGAPRLDGPEVPKRRKTDSQNGQGQVPGGLLIDFFKDIFNGNSESALSPDMLPVGDDRATHDAMFGTANKYYRDKFQEIMTEGGGSSLLGNARRVMGSFFELHSIFAPFLYSFYHNAREREFSKALKERYRSVPKEVNPQKLAIFTDTWGETNGVTVFLR
ncbi:hypothetical protein ACFL1X_13465, partial [Candidatus Hydrogenedentota bacterium]